MASARWRFADMYSRMCISQVFTVCVCGFFSGTIMSTVPWPSRTLSSGTLECWLSSWSGWSWRRARNWTAVIIVWARWGTFVQMKSVIFKRGIHQFDVFFLSWPKWFVWGYLFFWQTEDVPLNRGGNWVSHVSVRVKRCSAVSKRVHANIFKEGVFNIARKDRMGCKRKVMWQAWNIVVTVLPATDSHSTVRSPQRQRCWASRAAAPRSPWWRAWETLWRSCGRPWRCWTTRSEREAVHRATSTLCRSCWRRWGEHVPPTQSSLWNYGCSLLSQNGKPFLSPLTRRKK